MARDGYLIMDSDLHMMEPDDLWARYLDEPYRQNPPRFFGAHQAKLGENKDDKGNADNIMGMEIQGLAIPAHAGQTGATVSSRELRRRSRNCRRRRGNRDRAVPRGLLSLLSALLLRNPGGAVLLPADRRLLPAGRGLCALALYPAGLCRAGNRRPGIAAPDGASPTLSRALPR